jgi:uncharacterized membrane protein
MSKFIVAYAVTAVVLMGCDFTWLTLTGPYYRQSLHVLIADKVNAVPAILFYVVYVFGVVFFCVTPAIAAGWRIAARNGALFGFVAYGTYDFTNFATLKDWPASITIYDLCWGTLLTALSATVGAFAVRRRPDRLS